MITDRAISQKAGLAKSIIPLFLSPASSQTALVARVLQMANGFVVENVAVWCSALVGAVTAIVGIVRAGKTVGGITFVIGTTVQKFKSSVAFIGVGPVKTTGATPSATNSLPPVVNVPITDNIAFSIPFTINVAAAAGQFWGAVRVQYDPVLNVFSTKVAAQDQTSPTEAAALYGVPAADSNKINCGTITIQCTSGAAFLAQTTALNAAGTTVNYYGVAAGFVDVCTADPAFVGGSFLQAGMLTHPYQRACLEPGALIVVQYTSNGSGALTDGLVEIGYRAWPLNGEVPTTNS